MSKTTDRQPNRRERRKQKFAEITSQEKDGADSENMADLSSEEISEPLSRNRIDITGDRYQLPRESWDLFVIRKARMGCTKAFSSIWNFLRRQKLTDWAMAVFAGGSVYFAALQYKVNTVEDRPWIQIRIDSPTVQEADTDANFVDVISGTRLRIPMRYENTGKAPARSIKLVTFVQLVDNDKDPSLDCIRGCNDRHLVSKGTDGLLFPNEQRKFEARKMDSAMVSKDEAVQWIDGKKYVAVFGMISYQDLFGNSHETTFCIAHSNPKTREHTIHAQNCTLFNDAT